MPELEQVIDWLHALAVRRSQHVIDVPGGQVLLHDEFPDAHDHNKLAVYSAVDASELSAHAERVLGGAGRSHRPIEVLAAGVADQVGPDLVQAGYARDGGLLMLWRGAGTRPRAAGPVSNLGVAERAAVATAEWRAQMPDADPDLWRQLGERIRTVESAADPTYLAVRDPAGTVVARADLYLAGGVGQVEEVFTGEQQRGQGFASRLIVDAVDRAHASGASLVFLVADGDGWPQELYRRLGFTDLGRTVTFSR